MQPVEKENISSQLDNGKQVFGVYFIVPTGEKRILKINYEKKEFNDFSRPDYKIAFYFQKQSGTASDKLDFELNYPLFLKPIQIYPEGKIENQKTVFNTEMSKDRQFYLELVK